MLNIDTTVSDTKYYAANGIDDTYASSPSQIFVMGPYPPAGCTAGNLTVTLNDPLNEGTLTFTLRDDSLDTTLTCTIDGSSGAPINFRCVDSSNNPVIGGNSRLSITVTSSSDDGSSPTSVNAGFSWQCVP